MKAQSLKGLCKGDEDAVIFLKGIKIAYFILEEQQLNKSHSSTFYRLYLLNLNFCLHNIWTLNKVLKSGSHFYTFTFSLLCTLQMEIYRMQETNILAKCLWSFLQPLQQTSSQVILDFAFTSRTIIFTLCLTMLSPFHFSSLCFWSGNAVKLTWPGQWAPLENSKMLRGLAKMSFCKVWRAVVFPYCTPDSWLQRPVDVHLVQVFSR